MELPIAIIGIIGWFLFLFTERELRHTIRMCDRLLDWIEDWTEEEQRDE